MTARRIPALDGYRALAALAVVALHVLGFNLILKGNGGFWETFADGTIGNALDAFFIISGFTLFHQVILARGEVGSVRDFYRRRAVRIYPAYWLMLCVLLVFMAIPDPVGVAPYSPTFTEVVVQFSGFQQVARLFDATLLTGFGINGVTWFVSVILCFYLLFPLIARPYFRHPLVGLGLAALVSIGWKLAVAHYPGAFEAIQTEDSAFTGAIAIDQFPGFAFSFAAGMTAAWAYHRLGDARPRDKLERASVLLFPLALAGLAAAIYAFGHRGAHIAGAFSPTFVRGATLIPIAWSAAVAFAMLVILLGPHWMRSAFESRPARWIGDLSYGIFLIQAALIVYFGTWFPEWAKSTDALDVLLLLVAVLAGSILYAMASRRFVERPVADWTQRRARGAAEPLDARTANKQGEGPDRDGPSHQEVSQVGAGKPE